MSFALPRPLSVEIRDLACVRGGRLVFSGVNARVAGGGCLALTGPNGAGKTSLLRILAGLLPAEEGEVLVEPGEAEGLVHFLGYADGLKPSLTLRETLSWWSVLHGGRAEGEAIEAAAHRVGLAHTLDLACAMLSSGQRRRAGIARLIIAPRPLWLLDEPTSALDAAGEALLGNLMRDHLDAGGAIVAATHQALPVPHAEMLRMAA